METFKKKLKKMEGWKTSKDEEKLLMTQMKIEKKKSIGQSQRIV